MTKYDVTKDIQNQSYSFHKNTTMLFIFKESNDKSWCELILSLLNLYPLEISHFILCFLALLLEIYFSWKGTWHVVRTSKKMASIVESVLEFKPISPGKFMANRVNPRRSNIVRGFHTLQKFVFFYPNFWHLMSEVENSWPQPSHSRMSFRYISTKAC